MAFRQSYQKEVFYDEPSLSGVYEQRSVVNDEERRLSPNWWNEMNKLLYSFQTNRSTFFITLEVRVFANRVTLVSRPLLGPGETVQTFHASDVGYVCIHRGRKYSKVSVCSVNNPERQLFEIKGLKRIEAERLKAALDKMVAFNYLVRR